MPIKLDKVVFPGWPAIAGQPSFKYKSLEWAMENSTPFVRSVIDTMGTADRKWCVIDVKIVELKKSEFPCLSQWHYDCTRDKMDPRREEVHFIWQYGAGSYTQFENSFVLEPEFIYQYGRELHAPSPAQFSERRLLIRKTFSDIVRPKM